jgi:hypothetical protein
MILYFFYSPAGTQYICSSMMNGFIFSGCWVWPWCLFAPPPANATAAAEESASVALPRWQCLPRSQHAQKPPPLDRPKLLPDTFTATGSIVADFDGRVPARALVVATAVGMRPFLPGIKGPCIFTSPTEVAEDEDAAHEVGRQWLTSPETRIACRGAVMGCMCRTVPPTITTCTPARGQNHITLHLIHNADTS